MHPTVVLDQIPMSDKKRAHTSPHAQTHIYIHIYIYPLRRHEGASKSAPIVYRTNGDVPDEFTSSSRRDVPACQHFRSEARQEKGDRVPGGKRQRSEAHHGTDP